MDKRIAILRGINVGGKRKILMTDLKLLFKDIGFTNAQTYIQSGNVIFNALIRLTDVKIADEIEKNIMDRYGFFVPVIVRTVAELEQSIKNNSFYQEEKTDLTQLHLTFLKKNQQKKIV